VIEVAEACGLHLVDRHALGSGALDATVATSAGAGQLIAAALDAGARSIVLGLGVFDAVGAPVGPGGAGASHATRIDTAGLDPRLAGARILVASDVTNPLCGDDGAAAVYGPQKGLPPERIAEIDAGLGRFGALVERGLGAAPGEWTGRPGAGAAGGLGFAALAVLGGELRPGIDLVLDLLGFDAAVAGADLVITGEGRLDEQTLSGKAPAGVAARAGGAPVVLVCGSSALPRERAVAAGFREVFELVSIEPDAERCMREPLPLLERIGRLIGGRLAQLAARPPEAR
jgi:glycerate kinase